MNLSSLKNSLALKISLAIVLAQFSLMTVLGIFYVERFASEIDRRVLAQIKAPAQLMNGGTLALETVSHRVILQQIVGTEIMDALVVGPDNTVYYSAEFDDIGRSVLRITRLDPGLFSGTFGDSQFGRDADGNYVSIEPVYSAAGNAPFLEVYIKASGADIQREKSTLTWIFVGGSLATSLLISLLLILALQYLVLGGLKRLTTAARAVGSGRLDEATLAALPPPGESELGRLAQAFRDMAQEVTQSREQLMGYNKQLEADVASRTTELNRLVGVIKHEKARVETVIASISDGLCVISYDGTLVMLNPSLRKLFALGAGELVGLPYGEVLPEFLTPTGEPLAPGQHPLAKAVRERAAVDGAYAVRAGGRLLQIFCRVNLVKGDVDLLSMVAIFRDISEEFALDRAKRDFIDVAVHQLKTPLTALRWSVETLAEKTDGGQRSAEEAAAIKDVAVVTQRLNALVTSLLNISRIESGRLSVDPQPTDLKAVAADVIEEVAASVRAKSQQVRLTAEPGLPPLKVDASLVREVYKNLLTNAIKYSPADAHIEVSLAVKGGELVSSVQDSGMGIPADERKRLASKFFRASNAVSSHEDGTGLGLYLVSQIVDVSGGRFWFESEVGEGSTFYFSLPLAGSQAKRGQVKLS